MPQHDRAAPLDMDPQKFREAGHRLVDEIAEFLSSIRQRPVTRAEPVSVIRRALDSGAPVPHEGTDAAALLEQTAKLLIDHSLHNGHPAFWGYITSSAAPVGMLGDLLASAINANVGAWKLAPVATEIESQTIRWIAELIGFPTGCGGIFVSGGNMANFVCFLAARATVPGGVRSSGVAGERRLRVYASRETHTWIQKAADLFGLGTDAIRSVPTDSKQRVSVEALRRQVENDAAAGDLPFLVIGTAGSVSTGAIDPLSDLSAFCRERNLWFHVDGTYGGLAAMLPDAPADLKALSGADSIAVDPHKWLYAPLEAGCALVRSPAALPAAFAYHPAYYHFDESTLNYNEYGPQNSRGFRALKVWLALKQVGRAGYERMIADDIELARELYERVDRAASLQALTHNLSITTFRFVPPALQPQAGTAAVDEYLNRLNQEVLTRLEAGGEMFLSNAVVDGRFALRACIVNFRTSRSDIAKVPEIVVRLGEEIDATIRTPGT